MLTLCPKCSQFHGRAEKRCPFCGARRVVTAALVGAAMALGAGCSQQAAQQSEANSKSQRPKTDDQTAQQPRAADGPTRVIPVPPYGVPTPDARLERAPAEQPAEEPADAGTSAPSPTTRRKR